jgi:putative ABC transport system substrate-binding protein
MMRRRELFMLVAGAMATWPPIAGAQTALPVIGYLNAAVPEGYSDSLRAFRQTLKAGGYVEGENVTIVYRWGENETNRLIEAAADLVRQRVNVIVASSAPAAVVAAEATKAIPIVFMVPEDPVRLGLVTNLARPGGNATGINFFAAELAAKRLELLRTLVPTATRIAVLLNPAEPTIYAANRRDVEAAAAIMGLQLLIYNAGTIMEIDAAFTEVSRERPDALFVSSGPFFANRSVQLAHLATRYAIPAIGGPRGYPEVGGLISYGASIADAHREVGVYVGRILKGAKPADLPIVQSTKFELVINAGTARILGLTVPPSLLAAADEVIE